MSCRGGGLGFLVPVLMLSSGQATAEGPRSLPPGVPLASAFEFGSWWDSRPDLV